MLEAMGVATTTDTATPLQPAAPKPAAPAAASGDVNPGASSAAPDAGADRRAGGLPSSGRDISLTTLVHLLGLPTATQVDLLETKLDLLSTKVSQILVKLDRLVTDLSTMKNDATVDRIDFQLSDIRALLKRLVPTGIIGDPEPKSDSSKSASNRAKILTSDAPAAAKAEPKKTEKAETKIVEQDQLAEFNQSQDDGTFQAEEGRRVRMQTKEGA